MILKKLLSVAIALTVLMAALPVHPVEAARGMPGSGQFGVGVRIDLKGHDLNHALVIAAKLDPDWIVVDLRWDEFQPKEDMPPNWTALDQVMVFAGGSNTPVLLSFSGPPKWALTESGPNPALTYQFISLAIIRYPKILTAVEVLAAANTRAGWGARPNPKAYAALFSNLQDHIAADNHPVFLIAGGLTPVGKEDPQNNMNDLKFLQQLYDNGLKGAMPIVSMHLPQTTGEPLTPTDGREYHYLRHYEEVRQVMLKNKHGNGLIWISKLASPDGAVDREDGASISPQAAEQWMLESFKQLQSQLYLGVAVVDALPSTLQSDSSFILESSSVFIDNIKKPTPAQTPSTRPIIPGRPKSQTIHEGGSSL